MKCLAGSQLESLQFNYDGLKSYGVKVVTDEVLGIDYAGKLVLTKGGISYPYDRCVVSPGIDFKYELVKGYSEDVIDAIPHAWKAGPQTLVCVTNSKLCLMVVQW